MLYEIRWKGRKINGEEWLEGSLYDDGGELYILPPFPGSAIDYEEYQIDPSTLKLWIGKIDKHRKRVWTGDVIRDIKGRIWKLEILSSIFQIVLKNVEDERIIGLSSFNFCECEVINNEMHSTNL